MEIYTGAARPNKSWRDSVKDDTYKKGVGMEKTSNRVKWQRRRRPQMIGVEQEDDFDFNIMERFLIYLYYDDQTASYSVYLRVFLL